MDAIVFESVSKIFNRHLGLFRRRLRTEHIFALRDISFRVRSGSVLAILGPNGSGKTTLLKLISTMLLPDEGRALVHGANTRTDAQRVRASVGFAVAGERSFFPRLTARENLDFFAALDNVGPKLRRNRIDTVLVRTGLVDASDTLAMNFSSGMYQRLAIARALMKHPAILLLDEPTRSLDTAAASDVLTLVRHLSAEGTTFVIATHNLEEISAVADSALVLRRGRVAAICEISRTNVEGMQSLYSDAMLDAQMINAGSLVEISR